jgi:hypothetical protein
LEIYRTFSKSSAKLLFFQSGIQPHGTLVLRRFFRYFTQNKVLQRFRKRKMICRTYRGGFIQMVQYETIFEKIIKNKFDRTTFSSVFLFRFGDTLLCIDRTIIVDDEEYRLFSFI